MHLNSLNFKAFRALQMSHNFFLLRSEFLQVFKTCGLAAVNFV